MLTKELLKKFCDQSECRFVAMPLSLRRGVRVRRMLTKELLKKFHDQAECRFVAMPLSLRRGVRGEAAEETIILWTLNRVSMIGPTNTVLMNSPFGGRQDRISAIED
jgi:hypothetical protein